MSDSIVLLEFFSFWNTGSMKFEFECLAGLKSNEALSSKI
jgi:hypothetical protein